MKQISANAIATPHTIATQAGVEAFKKGGNALDAALAAATALCVVYPHNVQLGGDLVALVRSPDGEVSFLNATGTAAKNETLEALRQKHGKKLPLRHIDTVTVPGGVAGWQELHDHGARLSWEAHFETAIAKAQHGFPVSKSLANELLVNKEVFLQDPGMREVFYAGVDPIREGDQLKQSALAKSLRAISQGGSKSFYSGALAEKWVAGLQRLGSKITVADASEYKAFWDEPLMTEHAGMQVFSSPPNTSGFMFLRSLNHVAGISNHIAGSNNASTAGVKDPLNTGAGELTKIFAAANAVRALHLSDPAFAALSGNELVAMPDPKHPYETTGNPTGDTVGVSAVSEDGWAVSLINSVYYGFGVGVLDPETGIVFQNRGAAFSLNEVEASIFEPGKRPKHTLMPALVLRAGEVVYVPATMGGAAQPQIHTQLLLRLRNGETPADALAAPRWILRDPDSTGVMKIFAEKDMPETTLQALRESGYPVEIVAAKNERLGHANLVEVVRTESGSTDVLAASDPRSDGSAAVVSL